MSEISANIVVEPFDIAITVESPGITVNPEVLALNVYTSGSPGNPGGNTGELQYNTGSGFGGVPNVTYASGNLTLGNVSNIKITGGTNGYVLQTDGSGNLSWTAQTGGGGGNGTPGGSNTQIQYNDNNDFGASANFTWDSATNTLGVLGNA